MSTALLSQKHYGELEFDCSEKDIIQIWQAPLKSVRTGAEIQLLQIERENLPYIIDFLQKQLNTP